MCPTSGQSRKIFSIKTLPTKPEPPVMKTCLPAKNLRTPDSACGRRFAPCSSAPAASKPTSQPPPISPLPASPRAGPACLQAQHAPFRKKNNLLQPKFVRAGQTVARRLHCRAAVVSMPLGRTRLRWCSCPAAMLILRAVRCQPFATADARRRRRHTGDDCDVQSERPCVVRPLRCESVRHVSCNWL